MASFLSAPSLLACMRQACVNQVQTSKRMHYTVNIAHYNPPFFNLSFSTYTKRRAKKKKTTPEQQLQQHQQNYVPTMTYMYTNTLIIDALCLADMKYSWIILDCMCDSKR